MPSMNLEGDVLRILAFLRTASRVERRLDRSLACTRGLSLSEYQLLRELAGTFNGAAARVDLADAVGLTPSAVTRALKPLEKLGYVTTERDERDARRSVATITAGGERLLDDADGVFRDGVRELTLSATDRRALDGLSARLAR